MKKRKKGLVIGLLSFIIALIIATGGKFYMDNKEKENENIANQRLAALMLRKEEPHATKVLFTSEGSHPGVGLPWTVGAEVTIGNDVFDMSLETDEISIINYGTDKKKMEKYTELREKKNIPNTPLEVVYSNGKCEVLQ
ncbi:hypothetical protein AALM99_06995 [Lactococcus muris]|uniref:Uncharacterized protein n=1 Tax=Lactococcus muris TaxID=2941330 RepID=A0ABV4D9V3_9LACT